MNQKQLKTYELLKEFVFIAEAEKINYCVFYGTLLGAIRHKGIIPWDDDIDILLDKKGLDVLKNKYPEFVWTTDNSENILLINKFVKVKKNEPNASFLDLFVLVRTNRKKIKKYLSLKNKIRYMRTFTHRKTFKGQWGVKIMKMFFWWTWGMKKTSFDKTYKMLEDKSGALQHIINFPFKKLTWDNTFDLEIDFFKTKKVKFEDIEINVPVNSEAVLETLYGKNWRTPIRFKVTDHLGLFDMKQFYREKNKK